MRSRHLGQVHAGYGPKVDAKGLQEDGEDVGKENHKEQFEAVARSGCDVGGVVPGINVCLECYVSGWGLVGGGIAGLTTATMKPGPMNLT